MVAAGPQWVMSKESAGGRGRCCRASRIVHSTSTLGVPNRRCKVSGDAGGLRPLGRPQAYRRRLLHHLSRKAQPWSTTCACFTLGRAKPGKMSVNDPRQIFQTLPIAHGRQTALMHRVKPFHGRSQPSSHATVHTLATIGTKENVTLEV